MKCVESYYNSQIIEMGFYVSDLEYLKVQNEIIKLKNKFIKTNICRRLEYIQESKYYLQNKKKKDTGNIQEKLRDKVASLNETYKDNRYFIDIEKEVQNKKENKHPYNIFHIKMLEYDQINIYYDFICKKFQHDKLSPIIDANLNDKLKLKLYNIIDDTINVCEIYSDYDANNNVKYYNRYFKYYTETVYNFFINLYSYRDKDVRDLRQMLKILDENILCSQKIPLLDTLKLYYGKSNKDDTVEKIIKLLIKMDWSLDMVILNVDDLERELEELLSTYTEVINPHNQNI